MITLLCTPSAQRGFLSVERSVEDVRLQFQRAIALPFKDMRREATYRLSILIGRRPVRSPVNDLVVTACVDRLQSVAFDAIFE